MIIEIIVPYIFALLNRWIIGHCAEVFAYVFPRDEGKYVAWMKKNCCYSEGNAAECANVLPKVTRQVHKKYKINLCLGRKYSEFEKICSKK